MLECFADDSGSDNQGPVFVLAGYVSTEDRWTQFCEEWVSVLNSGPKPLAYFKMVEANSKKGEFLAWKDVDRDSKLIELSEIIQRYALFDIRCVLRWKDYEEVQKCYPQYQVSPYELLFHQVMIRATLHLHRLHSNDLIKFYFDDQNKIGDQVLNGYSRQMSTLPEMLLRYVAGPPNFKDEKRIMPLQAADLLAWQVRRSICEMEKSCTINVDTERQALPRLDKVSSELHNFDRAELQDFFKSIEPWMKGN